MPSTLSSDAGISITSPAASEEGRDEDFTQPTSLLSNPEHDMGPDQSVRRLVGLVTYNETISTDVLNLGYDEPPEQYLSRARDLASHRLLDMSGIALEADSLSVEVYTKLENAPAGEHPRYLTVLILTAVYQVAFPRMTEYLWCHRSPCNPGN